MNFKSVPGALKLSANTFNCVAGVKSRNGAFVMSGKAVFRSRKAVIS